MKLSAVLLLASALFLVETIDGTDARRMLLMLGIPDVERRRYDRQGEA